MAGSKRVEFRRKWAVENVGLIAIYSSSPIQRIVGLVEIESVVVGSISAMLRLSAGRGGGLTRKELQSYFAGSNSGTALLLGRRFIPKSPIEPSTVFQGFRAPQSFRYLTTAETKKLERRIDMNAGKT
jgi:predicted transcriptional regulator